MKAIEQIEKEIIAEYNVNSINDLTEKNWNEISEYVILSEEFIDKHKGFVNWGYISIYQELTEPFIEEYKNYVNWKCISKYQKLSESFIEKYKNKVYWNYISKYQKLSEEFIEKHKNLVDWEYISSHQKLSEEFIEKHKDLVVWDNISKYQKLSKQFVKKYNLVIGDDNWLYQSTEFKKNAIMNCKLYETYDDYFIAYKSIRKDNYSVFNNQYKYGVGKSYTSHADFTKIEDSFGLSAWTLKGARNYYDKGKIIKVKIYYKDVARLIYDDNKIRCTRLEVIDEL